MPQPPAARAPQMPQPLPRRAPARRKGGVGERSETGVGTPHATLFIAIPGAPEPRARSRASQPTPRGKRSSHLPADPAKRAQQPPPSQPTPRSELSGHHLPSRPRAASAASAAATTLPANPAKRAQQPPPSQPTPRSERSERSSHHPPSRTCEASAASAAGEDSVKRSGSESDRARSGERETEPGAASAKQSPERRARNRARSGERETEPGAASAKQGQNIEPLSLVARAG